MPGDDKPRRPTYWGDEERAQVGAPHRRPTPLPFDAVPEPRDPDEVTSPVELLLREPTDEDREYARELDEKLTGRSLQSPATYADLLKVAAALATVKKDSKRERRESANQTLQVAASKLPPLERLDTIERKVRVMWALLGAALTAAAGSAITVGKGLYERGASEGAQQYRMERLEKDVERLERELRMERRRTDYPLPVIAPKGTENK